MGGPRFADGDSEDERMPGVAQCGLVPAHGRSLTPRPRGCGPEGGLGLNHLSYFLIRDSMRGWAGILVGQDPGSEMVSSAAHPCLGGMEQTGGRCLAHFTCSVDAYGMTK